MIFFDADFFASACAHAWQQMREQRLTKATSGGALFDAMDERLLDELYEAQMSLSKVE
jgi:hypothetical protein